MQKVVTVILPSYNHGRYLKKRIDSIINQTYKDFELIIIDDCSPDNSVDIIKEYTHLPNVTFIENTVNSGTPFSAWGEGIKLAKGKYIWICESDDFAEPSFLEKGVSALEEAKGSVLFYTNSNVVNGEDEIIGNTASYFSEIWKDERWKASFIVEGTSELATYQIFGQTVPNMSSALFEKAAFSKAYTEYLKRFRLTGDWLFVGLVMKYGKVIFLNESLNNFREHENTSRAIVNSAKSQAEFILTKFYLYREINGKTRDLCKLLAKDAIRHIYEDASFVEIFSVMLKISKIQTIKLIFYLAISVLTNRQYLRKYFQRKKLK